MAVYRTTPTCSYCGNDIAIARHKDESDLPNIMKTIGDTFIEWITRECNCRGAKQARKQAKKEMDEYHKNNPFDFKRLKLK